MFMRKLKIHTEETVYPNVTDEDIRFDLFPKIRIRATTRQDKHPWEKMTDKEIIKSAGLYSQDKETKEWGYNLAAVLLLGKDETIKRICPQYRTDALMRKNNVERYDDRLIVETNIIDSYDILMDFARKHLLDKFHLEDNRTFSLSGAISREMIVNSLAHREYTDGFYAKFVIEKDRMYIENANVAARFGNITPNNIKPKSKNPLIAAFFRNIGYADELGSGTRNLYRYVKLYSGKDPEIIEDDIFKIIVPLDDNYSFDVLTRNPTGPLYIAVDPATLKEAERKVYDVICEGVAITRYEIATASGVPERSVRRAIESLTEKGLIVRIGSNKSGKWVKPRSV